MKEADTHRSDVIVRTASGGKAVQLPKFNKSALFATHLALLVVGYYFAARLGFGFRFQGSQVGIIWPANALFLAALVLAPRRRWWPVLIAASLAHVAALGPDVPVWRLLWQIAGNSVFVVATAETLRRIVGLPLHFGSRRQVIAYGAISFMSPLLFTLMAPAFVRSLFHLELNFTPFTALLRLTLTNATALLLVTPVVVLWAEYGLQRVLAVPVRRLYEAATIAIFLLAVGFFAFDTKPEAALFPALLLWFLPPLLWVEESSHHHALTEVPPTTAMANSSPNCRTVLLAAWRKC